MRLTHEDTYPLPLKDFIGERTAVLGQSGSGKSTTLAVLEAEAFQANLLGTLIDPDGEAYGLRTHFANLLIVGKSRYADREYTPEQMGKLAELSVTHRFSVALDLDGYTDEEAFDLLVPYLQSIWLCVSQLRRPYQVWLDEAQDYAPQIGKTPLKALLILMAKRGRKRGLGMVIASQRASSVDKNLLSQTRLRFLHQVSYPSDLEVYKDLMPHMSGAEVEQSVPELQPGEAFLIHRHRPFRLQVRERDTFDPGQTPQLDQDPIEPVLLPCDPAILALVDAQLTDELASNPEIQDRATLIRQIESLRQKLAHLQTQQRKAATSPPASNTAPSSGRGASSQQCKEQRIGQEPTGGQQEKTQAGTTTLEIAQATVHSLVLTGALPREIEHQDQETQFQALATELEQAHQQLVVQAQELERLRLEVETTHQQASANEPQETPLLTTIDTFLWQPLQRQITSLDPTARSIVRMLFAYEQKHLEQAFTLKELAVRLQKKVEQMRPHFPTQLVDLGLLTATPRGSAHTLHYRSQARTYLRREFEEHQVEPLLQELIRLLSQ